MHADDLLDIPGCGLAADVVDNQHVTAATRHGYLSDVHRPSWVSVFRCEDQTVLLAAANPLQQMNLRCDVYRIQHRSG